MQQQTIKDLKTLAAISTIPEITTETMIHKIVEGIMIEELISITIQEIINIDIIEQTEIEITEGLTGGTITIGPIEDYLILIAEGTTHTIVDNVIIIKGFHIDI